MMRSFDEIYQISAQRQGDEAALEALLSKPKTQDALLQIPEDRWLSAMTRGIFQAGFSWKVIEAKWPGFETAFKGFAVDACAMMNDDWFDTLLTDTSIVRNGSKIRTVQENAVFISELRAQGGVSKVFADWPAEDFVGLIEMIKKNGSRLGGTTGQYLFRVMGKDSFILSKDVTGRLIAEGVIDKPATSKTALKAVQAAFNTWQGQSGRSLTEISRVLALSL
jgi:3-methyladenine DNA glycosylase Tag